MNREQWLRKRSQVETHGIAPAFGAPNFAGQTKSMGLAPHTDQDYAAIQQQHFGDELAGDGWPGLSPLAGRPRGESH